MAQLFNIKKITVGPKNLVARVELAASAPVMTSEDLEGTTRVWKVMPELRDHVCLGDASGKFGDVMGDTELAHLLEHVAVELLARTDIAGDVTCGQTAEVGEREYEITFPCSDDVLVVGALSSAVWLMQWAFSGGGDPMPDADAIASGLVDLVKSLPEVEEPEEAEEVIGVEEGPAPEPAYAPEPMAEAQPQPSAPVPAPQPEPAEPQAPSVSEDEVDQILSAPMPEPAPEEAVNFAAESPNEANEQQVENVSEVPASEPIPQDEPVYANAAEEPDPASYAEAPAAQEAPEQLAQPEPDPALSATAYEDGSLVEAAPAEPAAADAPADPVVAEGEAPADSDPALGEETASEPAEEPEPAPEPIDDWGLGNVPRPRAVR